MSSYPEIEALNKVYVQYKVEVQVSRLDCLNGSKEYPFVSFTVGGKTFKMFANDENSDFRYNYPLLNLCVVLRELEYYNETKDFLVWCAELYLDPSNNQVLAYYRDLARIYREVEGVIGEISSHVSDWDFEMGSGAMYELRKIN